MLPRPGRPRRPAFTVLELLVVIGIIAVILSLASSAVMAIMRAQETKSTELTIKRADEALKAHVLAVLDQAKELPIPANVLALGNNDPRTAKVIWQKLQLKRNFPVTYYEAAYPYLYTGNTKLKNPLAATDLPPLDRFVQALKRLPAAYVWGSNPQAESSALLLLTLSENRRGVTFDPEQSLGVGSLIDTNGDGLNEIVDAWSQPIALFRFPTDYNGPNTPATLGPSIDLQDPELTLQSSTWQSSAAAPLFQQHCHALATLKAPLYLPTIVSGGPNKRLGLLFQAGSISPNFGMAVGVQPDENDNIYSYSLR